MNPNQIELLAVNAVEDYFTKIKRINPTIPVGDKEPSWDGFLYLYSDDSMKKETMIGRIPVQGKYSFMSETDCYGDLRKQSLLDIWKNNQYFINFRNKEIPNRCLLCSHKKICMGGCKFIEEINFCKV